MTDYIEEMMRTAGVEPKYIVEESDKEMKVRAVFPTKEEAIIYQSKFGGDLIKGFDFTSAKQLEIIKLIKVDINTYGLDWCLAALTLKGMIAKVHTDFDQALALLCIELMKTGELDMQKVKEILANE